MIRNFLRYVYLLRRYLRSMDYFTFSRSYVRVTSTVALIRKTWLVNKLWVQSCRQNIGHTCALNYMCVLTFFTVPLVEKLSFLVKLHLVYGI
jgi:hypothetical protein